MGVDLISDAEWDWIKVWVLNVFAGLMCYVCARTAVKVQIQVRMQILSFTSHHELYNIQMVIS